MLIFALLYKILLATITYLKIEVFLTCIIEGLSSKIKVVQPKIENVELSK